MEPLSRETLLSDWHEHVDGAPWFAQWSILTRVFQYLPVQHLQTVAPLVCREWATFLFSHPAIWPITQEGPWTAPTARSSQGLYVRSNTNYATLAGGGRASAVAVAPGIIAVGNASGIHVFLLGADSHLLTINAIPSAPTHLTFGGVPANVLVASFACSATIAFALPPCGLSGGAFAPSLATPCVWMPAAVLDAVRLSGHPLSPPFSETTATAQTLAEASTEFYAHDNGSQYLDDEGVNVLGGEAPMTNARARGVRAGRARRVGQSDGHLARRVLLTPAVVKAAYAACPPRAVVMDLSSYGFGGATVTSLCVAPGPAVVVGDAAGRVGVWGIKSLFDGTPPGVANAIHPPSQPAPCTGKCFCFDGACVRASAVTAHRIVRGFTKPARGFSKESLPTGRRPPHEVASRFAFLRPAVATLVGVCVADPCDQPPTSMTDGSGNLPRWRHTKGVMALAGGTDDASMEPAVGHAAVQSVDEFSAGVSAATVHAVAEGTGHRICVSSGAVVGSDTPTRITAHAGRVTCVAVVGHGPSVLLTGGADNAVRVFAWPSLIHLTTLGGLLGPPTSLSGVLLCGRPAGAPTPGVMCETGDVIGCGLGGYVANVAAEGVAEAAQVETSRVMGGLPVDVVARMTAGTPVDPPLAVTAASVAELATYMPDGSGSTASANRKRAAPGDNAPSHRGSRATPLAVGVGVLSSPGDGHDTSDGGPPDAKAWHLCAMAAAGGWPPSHPPPLPVPGFEYVISAVGADRRLVWWALDLATLSADAQLLSRSALGRIAVTPTPFEKVVAAQSAARREGLAKVVAYPPNTRPQVQPIGAVHSKRSAAAAAAVAAALEPPTVVVLPGSDVQLSLLRALMMRVPEVSPYLPTIAEASPAGRSSSSGAAAEGDGSGAAGRAHSTASGADRATPTPAGGGDDNESGEGGDSQSQRGRTSTTLESPRAVATKDKTSGGGAVMTLSKNPATSSSALQELAVKASDARFAQYSLLVRDNKLVFGTLLLRLPAGGVVAVRNVSAATPLPLLTTYVALACGLAVTSVMLVNEDGAQLVPNSPSVPHPIVIPPAVAPGGSPLSTYACLPVASGPWGAAPGALPSWAEEAVAAASLTEKDMPFASARVAVAPTGTTSALLAPGIHVTAFGGGTALSVAEDGAAHRFDLTASAHRSLRYVSFDSRVHPGTRPRQKEFAQSSSAHNFDVTTLHGAGHNIAPICVKMEVRDGSALMYMYWLA